MNRPNVHRFTDGSGNTRYAVCVWVESAGQYQAPLDAQSRRLTGCHAEFARTLSGIGGYTDLQKARRRARKLFGYSKLGGNK